MQKLNESTASRLQDLLMNPPTTKQYEAMQATLLEGFTKSLYQRMGKFFTLLNLSDR